MSNVMIDLETLGVTADAVIMSIGAVRFELDRPLDIDQAFYQSISIDSNLALGRRIDENTLIFWLKQSPEAQSVFYEPKTTLESALLALADFVQEGDLVWSNGASFDIPMLEHAYRQLDIEAPWKFSNSRCMRTFKNLPGAKGADWPTYGVAHNARDDAIAQALLVQAIHQHLFAAKVPA